MNTLVQLYISVREKLSACGKMKWLSIYTDRHFECENDDCLSPYSHTESSTDIGTVSTTLRFAFMI